MKNSTVRKLHILVAKLDKHADVILQENFGVSFSRARFLLILLNNGPMTQHQLAVTLGQSDPAVSTMLTELKKQDLVSAEQDPTHGRRRIVNLTLKGKKFATEIGELLSGNYGDLLKSSDVEENQLNKLLDKMLENFN